jgi:hypothetical protein
MKKSINIRIPKPCHEDWKKMTQTEKGKFCGVCTKEVIDFTTKTDEYLVKTLTNTKNTCGRFKKTQLNRVVKMERKSGLKLAPYAASLLLPLSLLNTTNVGSVNTVKDEKPYYSLNIGKFSKANRVIIYTTGVVRDSSGKALQNVEINSNESKDIVKSDRNGFYSIKTMDSETLYFKHNGFVNYEIVLGNYSSEKNISMTAEICEIEIISTGDIDIFIEGEIETPGIINEVQAEEELKEISIHGIVRDESGLVLPGVRISAEGTAIQTQSDFDGYYAIAVQANKTLQFSYNGYKTISIYVANISNVVHITLEPSAAVLGEVIVAGMIVLDSQGPSTASPNAPEVDKAGEKRKLSQQNSRKPHGLKTEERRLPEN